MRLNPDKEIREDALRSLRANFEKYGKAYCPCILPHLYNNDDYVCPCKHFREEVEYGEECNCGLYIK